MIDWKTVADLPGANCPQCGIIFVVGEMAPKDQTGPVFEVQCACCGDSFEVGEAEFAEIKEAEEDYIRKSGV